MHTSAIYGFIFSILVVTAGLLIFIWPFSIYEGFLVLFNIQDSGTLYFKDLSNL